MTATPTALDVHAAVATQLLAAVHTCMPAEVVRVHAGDSGRQFVDVQPSLRRLAFDESGDQIQETLPMLPMVPVAFMAGGGFFIALPLRPGDRVTLVFAERSLDQWLEVARQGGGPVDQSDAGTHTLEGAIALPCGPQPRPELLQGVDGADLVIGGPAGILARFQPSGDIVLAEGDVPLALATAVAAELAAVRADIATLKAAVLAALGNTLPAAPPPPPATLATIFTAATAAVPSSPSSVASARIRGE